MKVYFDPCTSNFVSNFCEALDCILEHLCNKAFLNHSDAPSYSELSFVPVGDKVYVFYGDVVVAYIV